jgi:carbon monoxide dehydrogenase subunit G
VTLSSNVTSVAEDGGTGTVTATLSIATTADVTVELGGAGTATSGTDYTSDYTSAITISAGSLTGTASGVSIADDIYEGDETVIVSISSVSGGGATENGTQSLTVTITDAESAPTVNLSSSSASVTEDGSAITLTATLSNKADEAVTVPITTSGTATEGTDYATISDITIAAGATTGTASITPTDDSVSEGIETLVVSLGTLSGADATAGSTSSISLNLVDDDVPNITLTTSAASIAENSSSSLTLTATTSMVATDDIVVTLGAAGTATSGTDYTALPATVTIAAGATTATTSFTPKDDTLYDAASNETAIISITNVAGGNALESGDQSVTLTITDNESAPTVTLTSNVTTVAENGGAGTVTATLSVATYADVIVELGGTEDEAGTATEGTDYTSDYTTAITISAGSLTGTTSGASIADDIYEGNETVIVPIDSVSGGGATESGDQSVTITIIDSLEAPTVTLTSSAASIAEPVNSSSSLTLTATLNRSTYETVTVTLSTSGTSTAGTDYESLSSITISAGSATGTTAFTPKDDTLFENSETAIIAINTVSGGGATESGTQAVTIAITDKALDSGTQATYDSNNENIITNYSSFKNSDYSYGLTLNTGSSRLADYTPYQNINLHKALSYEDENGDKIMGSGQTIAIMDSGYLINGAGLNSATHTELQNITTTAQNTSHFTTFSAGNNDHGTMVAAIAASGIDGYVMGVAPEANLHIHDFNYSFTPEHWALGMTSAEAQGAIVQNNSWGFDQQYGAAGANVFVDYMNNNSLTGSETLVAFQSIDTNGDNKYDVGGWYNIETWTTSEWDNYISALDSFQDTGVVVFALSNDDTKTDADISAALPELFSSLQEAWITVANVDIAGTTSQSFALQSAPCGSTADYCLAADGHYIFGPGGTGSGLASSTLDGYTYQVSTGTSFAAPQVSGAVALLASHFPNHTPEALTDRLLASANNVIGFTQTGTVTFGNGVVHGYSNEAGHGILDIYAALQPITSDSYARNQIYAGSSSIGQSSFSLDSTIANLSRSFGDALEIGLENTNTYFYDALDGGFAVGMNDLVFSLNPVKPSLSVKSELSNLTSVSNKLLHFENTGWSETHDDRKGFFNASISSSPSALNNFYLNAGAADLGFAAYSMPTLSGIQGGDGFNLGLNMGEGFLTTSFTQTNLSNNLENEVQSSFITSYQQEISKDLTYSLMFGLADEGSKFLGMTGGGAFDLEGSKSNTSLAGAKVRLGVGEMSSIGFMAAISKSELSENNQGFITGIDNVTADTFALSFDTFNVFGNDKLSVSLSQPHRVNSGTMAMQIAGLADSEGNIPYTYHDIGLTPSGRQVDLSIGYSKDISENTTIGARFIHTKEAGHVKSAQDENSIFAGITYKNLNLGGSYVDVSNRVEAEINYTIRW